MNALRRRLLDARNDDGAALMTVILVTALVTALTMTVSVVATNNLVSAKLAQQAGAAVDGSDAGVAQAVSYLRQNGVQAINGCWTLNAATKKYDPVTPCTVSWARETNPATVNIGGKAGQSYRVWIKPLAAYPANKIGKYRIYSTGVAGGPAGRKVTTDVEVTPLPFVFGVVANSVDGKGAGSVHYESIYSTGCVSDRDKIRFEGVLDIAYGYPAAVRTSGSITTTNGCSGGFIHSPGVPCNPTYPYDQDIRGAEFILPRDAACYDKARSDSRWGYKPQFDDPDSLAFKYPKTSFMDPASIASILGVKRPPFNQSQLDQFKAIALSNGTYTNTTSLPSGVPAGPNAVVYYDLTGASAGGTVNLSDLIGPTSPWNRKADNDGGTCTAGSLVVIIEHGNAKLNSNSTLAGAIFLVNDYPDGQVEKLNGNAKLTGSLYADNVDLGGTGDFWMDQCFLNNLSPALMTVTTDDYREDDR